MKSTIVCPGWMFFAMTTFGVYLKARRVEDRMVDKWRKEGVQVNIIENSGWVSAAGPFRKIVHP